jgi:hypothetical protein
MASDSGIIGKVNTRPRCWEEDWSMTDPLQDASFSPRHE